MASSNSETEHDDEDEIEATEMHAYQEPTTGRPCNPKKPVSSLGRVYHSLKLGIPRPLKNFWNNQVSVTVSHDKCRDHFALERTFLSYLRTSMALTIVGVLIAQLLRLQHTEHPNMTLGFFVLGIPLAALCIGGSILILALGAYRFWKQQNAMLRGKVHAGGWDINCMGGIILLVTLIVFVLLVAVDIEKDQ